MPKPSGSALMDKLVALCKRRGFVFQSSEIYGGINGFWDYGPLGVELKNNLRNRWWNDMVHNPPAGPTIKGRKYDVDIVGLDCSIIAHPKVWQASGHVAGFNDPMVDCRETKNRYRADQISVLCWAVATGALDTPFAFVESDDVSRQNAQKKAEKSAKRKGITLSGEPQVISFLKLDPVARAQVVGPDSDQPGTLTEPRQFNLMFETYVGAVRDEDAKAYLRPETAQGQFYNFKNVLDSTRVKVPFGIAQIGKSFRNEVTPRNFIFRSREFEQMEMEFFCPPEDSQEWYQYWRDERMKWWAGLGIKPERLRLREHDKEELSHYSTGTADVEYVYPFTEPDFGELEGIAHRGCYDLTQHAKTSGAKLEYFDQERNQRYLPHVIEPASGLTRGVLVLLCEAYDVDESRPSPELMRFPASLAPIKAGVFPLVNKDGLPEIAEPLYADLKKALGPCEYDAKQSIGKRYARMDEAGTPFCVTIDGQTKQDHSVTVRERDTGAQVRIGLDKVKGYLLEKIHG